MKTNHLFASAALAVALLGAAPAYSQILGGGAHGGLRGAFGAGGMGRSLNGAAGGSLRGAASGQFDDLNHTRRTVDTKSEGATRARTQAAGATEHKADGIAAATRQDARQGEAQARKSGEALTGTAGAAARVAGEGAAHSREVNAAGALDGAASAGTLSNSGVPATPSGPQHGAGANSVKRSVEPAPRTDTKSSGISGNASHPSTEVTRPPSPGSSASASASADASLSVSADR